MDLGDGSSNSSNSNGSNSSKSKEKSGNDTISPSSDDLPPPLPPPLSPVSPTSVSETRSSPRPTVTLSSLLLAPTRGVDPDEVLDRIGQFVPQAQQLKQLLVAHKKYVENNDFNNSDYNKDTENGAGLPETPEKNSKISPRLLEKHKSLLSIPDKIVANRTNQPKEQIYHICSQIENDPEWDHVRATIESTCRVRIAVLNGGNIELQENQLQRSTPKALITPQSSAKGSQKKLSGTSLASDLDASATPTESRYQGSAPNSSRSYSTRSAMSLFSPPSSQMSPSYSENLAALMDRWNLLSATRCAMLQCNFDAARKLALQFSENENLGKLKYMAKLASRVAKDRSALAPTLHDFVDQCLEPSIYSIRGTTFLIKHLAALYSPFENGLFDSAVRYIVSEEKLLSPDVLDKNINQAKFLENSNALAELCKRIVLRKTRLRVAYKMVISTADFDAKDRENPVLNAFVKTHLENLEELLDRESKRFISVGSSRLSLKEQWALLTCFCRRELDLDLAAWGFRPVTFRNNKFGFGNNYALRILTILFCLRQSQVSDAAEDLRPLLPVSARHILSSKPAYMGSFTNISLSAVHNLSELLCASLQWTAISSSFDPDGSDKTKSPSPSPGRTEQKSNLSPSHTSSTDPSWLNSELSCLPHVETIMTVESHMLKRRFACLKFLSLETKQQSESSRFDAPLVTLTAPDFTCTTGEKRNAPETFWSYSRKSRTCQRQLVQYVMAPSFPLHPAGTNDDEKENHDVERPADVMKFLREHAQNGTKMSGYFPTVLKVCCGSVIKFDLNAEISQIAFPQWDRPHEFHLASIKKDQKNLPRSPAHSAEPGSNDTKSKIQVDPKPLILLEEYLAKRYVKKMVIQDSGILVDYLNSRPSPSKTSFDQAYSVNYILDAIFARAAVCLGCMHEAELAHGCVRVLIEDRTDLLEFESGLPNMDSVLLTLSPRSSSPRAEQKRQKSPTTPVYEIDKLHSSGTYAFLCVPELSLSGFSFKNPERYFKEAMAADVFQLGKIFAHVLEGYWYARHVPLVPPSFRHTLASKQNRLSTLSVDSRGSQRVPWRVKSSSCDNLSISSDNTMTPHCVRTPKNQRLSSNFSRSSTQLLPSILPPSLDENTSNQENTTKKSGAQIRRPCSLSSLSVLKPEHSGLSASTKNVPFVSTASDDKVPSTELVRRAKYSSSLGIAMTYKPKNKVFTPLSAPAGATTITQQPANPPVSAMTQESSSSLSNAETGNENTGLNFYEQLGISQLDLEHYNRFHELRILAERMCDDDPAKRPIMAEVLGYFSTPGQPEQ